MKKNITIPKEYRLTFCEEIQELDSDGYLLEHIQSGAKIVLMANDDANKVFTIGFRTPPQDDTGLPHILEHSVLCGSREFPAKDPFVELAKGSLNTFLNAMTYPDKTVYPVASCNDKDFQNLMHVYMDAVFFPNIYKKEEIFRQEGWSYAIEDVDAPLTYNGVVYNEMKGAFSSPEGVLEREIQHSLFPDSPYGFESGGDPDHITELTYKDFLDFHSRYYHPSNSYIYLYGDMDMEEKLTWMHEAYLSKFNKIEIDSRILLQPAFEEMKVETVAYPISESESERENTYLSWNVVVGESTDEKLYIAFQVLSHALISMPGAPLKQALLEAGIGKDVYGGYENGILQPVFSITAKNAEDEQKETFVRIITDTLEKIVSEGFDKDTLRGGLNSIEFQYREADFGRFPKGLMFGLQMFDSWLYDDNKPFIHLKSDETIAFLKDMLNTDYYENLVKTYLLGNPHTSVVVAVPKKGMTTKKDEQLAQKLADYKQSLSVTEVEKLVADTHALRAHQEAPSTKEELEAIPMIQLEDIKKTPEPVIYEEKEIFGAKVLHTNIFTNKIAYFNISFDASGLSMEELPYLGLLKRTIGYMNTEKYTYTEINNLLNIHTGGLDADFIVYEKQNAQIEDIPEVRFDLKGKILYDKTQFAMELADELLMHTDFTDERRLLEILRETKSRLAMSLNSSGSSAAALRAMSYYSTAVAIKDATHGIAYYHWLEQMEDEFETRKSELIAGLQNISKRLFVQPGIVVGYTGNSEGYEIFEKVLPGFLVQLPNERMGEKQIAFCLHRKNEGFKTSAQVQYAAQAGNFRKAGFQYHGALQVLSTIMNYEYLWTEIRVKGGAYGCSASFARNGNCTFTSYRDPHLKRTYEVFKKTPEFMRSFACDDRDMLKYIIGTISDIDTSLTPSGKGVRSLNCYFMGITYEDLQKTRTEVLTTTVETLRGLADLVASALEQDYVCVIGNEGKIQESDGILKEKLPLFNH